MPSPPSGLRADLDALLKEKAAYQQAVEDTRALLVKADQRRKESPSEHRRWDETIASLEQTLTASKSALARVTRDIETANAEEPPPSGTDNEDDADTAAESPQALPAAPPKPAAPAKGSFSREAERRKHIANMRRILDRCVAEKLGALTLADVALLVRSIEQIDLQERPDLVDAVTRQRIAALRKILRETLVRLDVTEGL